MRQQDGRGVGGGRPEGDLARAAPSCWNRTGGVHARRTDGQGGLAQAQWQPASGPERNTGVEGSAARIPAAAERGLQGAGSALPYLDAIQRAFGWHDVPGVSAHVGGPGEEVNQAMGAQAYAMGTSAAFAGAPDLHTAHTRPRTSCNSEAACNSRTASG